MSEGYKVGSLGGRPPVFDTEEALIAKCDEYFEYIKGKYHDDDEKGRIWDRQPEPATVTGLALYLGFSSRQSLYDYGKDEKFSYIVKKAKSIVEHNYEKSLSASNPTGAIFALKNMGWLDKSQTESVVYSAEVTAEEAKEIKKGLDDKY